MRVQIASFVSSAHRLAALSALSIWAIAAPGGSGCAHTEESVLTQGGVVDPQGVDAQLKCPRGTVFATGMTMGVKTSVWCERQGGVKHGPFLEWYENHQKKSAGEYEEGHRQGTWSFWLPSGQFDSHIKYDHGTVVP